MPQRSVSSAPFASAQRTEIAFDSEVLWSMPPPRSVRQLASGADDEPASAEAFEAMQMYAEGHKVDEMLQLLLVRLLEAQPLDPMTFLIENLQHNEELDALEQRCRVDRFDLRREKTKAKLVTGFFKRLVALQRSQHADKVEAVGPNLSRTFLQQQLQLAETRAHLRTLFPRHARDLVRRLSDKDEDLPRTIPADQFTRVCLQVLGTMASA